MSDTPTPTILLTETWPGGWARTTQVGPQAFVVERSDGGERRFEGTPTCQAAALALTRVWARLRRERIARRAGVEQGRLFS